MSFEYALLARDDMIDSYVDIPDYPDLKVKYMSYNNKLCDSYYSDAVCLWKGDLQITLLVNNKLITINSNDFKSNHANKVGKYVFTGLNVEIVNKSQDETYLIFRVNVF